MDSLKTTVLAKCGELWESYPDDEIWGNPVWKNTGGWFDVRNKTKTIRLECKAEIPETDEIWPLAAKILGIEDDQAEKDRELVQSVFERFAGRYGEIRLRSTSGLFKAIARLAGMKVQND